MAKLIQTGRQPWRPVRPELTTGISGQVLLENPVKMVLTKVAPGGLFRAHRDSYGHLFHILAGVGVAWVEEREYPLTAGTALQVDAGERHGYRNAGGDDLLLISLNLPAA